MKNELSKRVDCSSCKSEIKSNEVFFGITMFVPDFSVKTTPLCFDCFFTIAGKDQIKPMCDAAITSMETYIKSIEAMGTAKTITKEKPSVRLSMIEFLNGIIKKLKGEF